MLAEILNKASIWPIHVRRCENEPSQTSTVRLCLYLVKRNHADTLVLKVHY